MVDFLHAWLFVLFRGGCGGRVVTNAKYAPWFAGAAVADGAGARWAVFRKTRINEVPLDLINRLGRDFRCRLENGRFIVLGRGTEGQPSAFFDTVFVPREAGDAAAMFDAGDETPHQVGARAAVVSTYNRPQALARTLPQLTALGVPVLVVDDGSSAAAAAENRALAEANNAAYLALPANRGIAAAINAGIAYWLADPDVAWISYFQDDVDVDPGLFEVLAVYEDAKTQPVMTGLDTNEHAALSTVEADGRTLKYKDNSTGMHLHCHRDYWTAVLPVPARYLGAPKAGRGGSGADAWIVKRAPGSVVARGLSVLCVPGLVTTFAWRGEDSTWGNQHLLDRP
jgi:hypothetical protein